MPESFVYAFDRTKSFLLVAYFNLLAAGAAGLIVSDTSS
jgi:hypothetical protein